MRFLNASVASEGKLLGVGFVGGAVVFSLACDVGVVLVWLSCRNSVDNPAISAHQI